MEGLVMTAQIILSLSILVGLHELGHLIAAKFFKMRVEKFSIGFPPKLFGIKIGDTEYSVGAFPIGGYVKIAGMIDESLDTKAIKEPPKEYEFRAKPAWQRLIVMMGGVVVNVILGVVIFICITYFIGDNYISKDEVNKNGIEALEIGQKIGFETGDKIILINGKEFEDFADVRSAEVLLGSNSYYTVLRGNKKIDIFAPANLLELLSDRKAQLNFIEPRYPFEVGAISPGSEAERLGLMKGDRIIAIGDKLVEYFPDFNREKMKYAGRDIQFTVKRGNQILQMEAHLDSTALIGFKPELLIKTIHKEYSLAEAIPTGTQRAFSAVWVNARALGKIFKGEINPSKSLMGPIRIATEIFGGTWDWAWFWSITGLLSMVLAFINFLPIPALDGGHVMFLTFEIISGRKPSDKFLEVAQKTGMLLLMLLMAFVIFNDIFRLEFIQKLIGG